ncbi:MAG TPA: ATP-binding protein [Gaiellaceae bacterium]|nr:ATP-binding protein [Gaiellaceae bacterium]
MSVITSEDELERRVAERTAALLEALRSSEARFRALIENSLDITAIVDAETRLKYISSSVTAVLGYEPEELLGQTTFDYVHPDDAELVSASFRRGAESPDGLEPLEFRARRKDGTWLLMDARGLNLLHDPAVAGMVITARDVTARRALEERVRQSERLEAVGQLAGGVAHDFNNFLLVIRGYSSVLRSSLEDPQLRADVDEIANAADRAAELTRQLLAFGRRQVVQPRMLSLEEVVRGMHQLLRRTLPPSIDLDLVFRPGVAPVVADPVQIEQVVLNLVFNARDAMPDGGELRIDVGETPMSGVERGIAPPLTPGSYVTLTVADTGTGIAEDVLPHVFEPFFTTKADGVGTGLGLSTVHGIVAQAGGGIEVVPRLDGGVQFVVYFPAATGTIEGETWVATAPAEVAAGTETILLVEDEESVRELVRRVLEQAGYTVLSASRPSEAERLLDEAGHVDLLVSDVVMPEMSGYDLSIRITERRPEIRRLFMSGYAHRVSGAEIAEGLLLKKPFAPEQLIRAVRSTLDGDLDGTIA